MNNVPCDEIKNISRGANEMWTQWKSFFLDILNKHAPITYIQVKGNKIPYVTSKLKAMIRQRDYLTAKANRTGSSVLRQAYSQVRAKVNQKLYELRKTITLARLNNTSMTLKIRGKYLRAFIGKETSALTLRKKQYSTSYSSHICYGKRYTHQKFSPEG